MKVSIIAFNNLKKSPYVNIYGDFCKKMGMEYELVYPDRSGLEETADCPLIRIPWDPTKGKVKNFLQFRRGVIRHLNKNKRDFVIVLTTMPAVLLSEYLCLHYKGRFLVDIRDYTYEHVKPYYFLEKLAIKYAAMRVISSPGFQKFLPESEYGLCQNVSAAYAQGQGGDFSSEGKGIITIGYVGTVAYKKTCKQLFRLVAKDPRFRFYLYGDEVDGSDLTQYLEKNPCDRIKMFGAYRPEQKVEIMSGVDILFNAYGNGNKLLDYALSNKLYDAFYMRIPLLTSPNTAMSEEAGVFSYDIDLDNETSLDGLFNWYQSVDGQAFDTYSKKYLKQVFAEQEVFYTKLSQVLTDRKTK